MQLSKWHRSQHTPQTESLSPALLLLIWACCPPLRREKPVWRTPPRANKPLSADGFPLSAWRPIRSREQARQQRSRAGAAALPRGPGCAALRRCRRGALLPRPLPGNRAGAEAPGAAAAANTPGLRCLSCCAGRGADSAFSWASWGRTWESVGLPVCFLEDGPVLGNVHSRRCSLLYNLLYFCAFSSRKHQIRQEVVRIIYNILGRAAQNNLSGLAPENTEWFPLSLWGGTLACLFLPWLLYCVECYGDWSVLKPFMKIMALWLIFVHRVSLLHLTWV